MTICACDHRVVLIVRSAGVHSVYSQCTDSGNLDVLGLLVDVFLDDGFRFSARSS